MIRQPEASPVSRTLVKRHPIIHATIAYTAFLGVPLAVYWWIGRAWPASLEILHYAVATAYAVTAVVMLIEVRAALGRRSAPVPMVATADLPMVSVIVSAYLPNEQDLIRETILHLTTEMEIPSYKLQIILAYNTPDDLSVENVLSSFGRINASFTPLRVYGSTSKAENILAALPLCEGEMTVLLDADHHPLPDAFRRAYRWLQLGYDVVQGRCVVRNQTDNMLTRLVSVEFEHMYGVAHAGRSLVADTAIFGGTNGYWRTSVLREIGMDASMLTEDIDSSIRTILVGHKVVHDRSVISSEIATRTLRSWWNQRVRWSQGWFQVTLRHQMSILRTKHLRPATKLYWTYLLSWRELFPFLSLQIFALLGASALLGRPFRWFGNPYFLATAVLTLAAGPITSIACYRIALYRTKDRLRAWFVLYAVTNLIYTTMKNTVAMVAMVRETLGQRAWVVTTRTDPRKRLSVAQSDAASVEAFAQG